MSDSLCSKTAVTETLSTDGRMIAETKTVVTTDEMIENEIETIDANLPGERTEQFLVEKKSILEEMWT